MTHGVPTLLSSSVPCTVSPATVTIGHIQLRDLVICPHERGTVCYPHKQSIVEHDIVVPDSTPRRIAELGFTPNSLSTLVLPETQETILAAGGQEAELHLSLYAPSSSLPSRSDEGAFLRGHGKRFGRQKWQYERPLDPQASINNSVLLTSLSLTGSHESSVEPRVVVSNNDRTIKFFDIAVRSTRGPDGEVERWSPAGQLRLDVPVNHSSISPDGRTLLSVGDSPDVYLHRITGGSRITFAPMTKLSLSQYITTVPFFTYSSYPSYTSTSVPASFSTAFSANGSKFAVASQEGVVVVWDVRSTKPLKVVQTNKNRVSSPRGGNGGASGWLFEGPWDWARGGGRAPGWGVRSVKFSPAGVGREVMTFTEHTSLLHVIDARTFETEEIVRLPSFESPPPTRTSTARPRSTSPPNNAPSTSDNNVLPPPPRIVLFSGALEDTFRIPSAESSGRRRQISRRLHSRDDLNRDDDTEGIVVIPPLGDREVENDVRRLLGRHGIHSRTASALLNAQNDEERDALLHLDGEARGEEDMDVDELESDCLSSYTPSRAPSPAPSPGPPSYMAQPTSASRTQTPLERPQSRTSLTSRRETSAPYAGRRWGVGHGLRRHRRSGQAEGGGGSGGGGGRGGSAEVEVDQDLAGTCFDPSGEFIYVAAMKGVSEYKVRGAEQRWWIDSSWA